MNVLTKSLLFLAVAFSTMIIFGALLRNQPAKPEARFMITDTDDIRPVSLSGVGGDPEPRAPSTPVHQPPVATVPSSTPDATSQRTASASARIEVEHTRATVVASVVVGEEATPTIINVTAHIEQAATPAQALTSTQRSMTASPTRTSIEASAVAQYSANRYGNGYGYSYSPPTPSSPARSANSASRSPAVATPSNTASSRASVSYETKEVAQCSVKRYGYGDSSYSPPTPSGNPGRADSTSRSQANVAASATSRYGYSYPSQFTYATSGYGKVTASPRTPVAATTSNTADSRATDKKDWWDGVSFGYTASGSAPRYTPSQSQAKVAPATSYSYSYPPQSTYAPTGYSYGRSMAYDRTQTKQKSSGRYFTRPAISK